MNNIREFFVCTHKALSSGDYSEVNRMFNALEMSEEPSVLVGYLRGTCRMRSRIPEWDATFTKVWDELDRRGLQSRRLLRGLF